MTGYAALFVARLEEMGWSVSVVPAGNDWRVECYRGAERIVIAIPGYGLAAMAEAERLATKIEPPASSRFR